MGLAAQTRKPRSLQTNTWPASTRGLAADSDTLEPDPRQAARLQNLFPTTEGLRLRAGMVQHAAPPSQIGAFVDQLMALDTAAADYLIAAGTTTLWDATSDSVTPTLLMSGLGSGDWSGVQFPTTGGVFYIAVNGMDYAFIGNPTSTLGIAIPIGATDRLSFSAGFTTPFAQGETITGGTSGATALVLGVIDTGSGTDRLWIKLISGTFTTETVTGNLGGAGALTSQSSAGSLAPGITGVETNKLLAAWAHNRRLWFVERNSLNAWYLPIDSIGGAAVKFPLSGVFQKGGTLLFGQTFSSDSGTGMDDRLVFVTTEGEAAVYAVSPDLTAINLEGVYFIGRPLSKRGWYRVGGDLITLTELGAVSLATAISNPPEGLAQVSSTAPIMPFWQEYVAAAPGSHRWSCVINPRDQSLIISIPQSGDTLEYRCLVANVITGAWTIYTGWDCGALAILNGQVYMGCSSRRRIAKLGLGGSDMGDAYYGVWVPRFQLGANGLGHKTLVSGRAHYRAPVRPRLRLYGQTDQKLTNMAQPPTGSVSVGATWDGGYLWDGGTAWGGAMTRFSGQSEWQAIYGQGAQISVGALFGSNSAVIPELELMALEALYEPGALM